MRIHPPMIEFRTKPYPVQDGESETRRLAINWKARVVRTDCNLRAHEHSWYNSDLFVGMLNRAYRRIIGESATWCYLDSLPAGCTVDSSKFLAIVRILLPEDFR